MNNILNLILLYYKIVDKLKIKKAISIRETILLFSYFKVLLSKVLIIIIDFKFYSWLIKI